MTPYGSRDRGRGTGLPQPAGRTLTAPPAAPPSSRELVVRQQPRLVQLAQVPDALGDVGRVERPGCGVREGRAPGVAAAAPGRPRAPPPVRPPAPRRRTAATRGPARSRGRRPRPPGPGRPPPSPAPPRGGSSRRWPPMTSGERHSTPSSSATGKLWSPAFHLAGRRARPEPAEGDRLAVEGRLAVVRLEALRGAGAATRWCSAGLSASGPARRAARGVVLGERLALGGQHQPVGVAALLQLPGGGFHQRIGARAGHGAQHHRAALAARSELDRAQRLVRDAPFAEHLEQLRRADPPFEADEHGVRVELPGGVNSSQHVTHAAHRMRGCPPVPLLSATRVIARDPRDPQDAARDCRTQVRAAAQAATAFQVQRREPPQGRGQLRGSSSAAARVAEAARIAGGAVDAAVRADRRSRRSCPGCPVPGTK